MLLTIRTSNLVVLSRCNRARTSLRLVLETALPREVYDRWKADPSSWCTLYPHGKLEADDGSGACKVVQTFPDVPLPQGFTLVADSLSPLDKRAVQPAKIEPHSAGVDLIFDVEQDTPSPVAVDHRQFHRSVVEPVPFKSMTL